MKKLLIIAGATVGAMQAAESSPYAILQKSADSAALIQTAKSNRLVFMRFSDNAVSDFHRTEENGVKKISIELDLAGQICEAVRGPGGGLRGVENFPDRELVGSNDFENRFHKTDEGEFYTKLIAIDPANRDRLWRLVTLSREMGSPAVGLEASGLNPAHRDAFRVEREEEYYNKGIAKEIIDARLAEYKQTIKELAQSATKIYTDRAAEELENYFAINDGPQDPIHYDFEEKARLGKEFFAFDAEIDDVLHFGTQKQVELALTEIHKKISDMQGEVNGLGQRSFAVIDEIQKLRGLSLELSLTLNDFIVRQRPLLLKGQPYTPDDVARLFYEREKPDSEHCVDLQESRTVSFEYKAKSDSFEIDNVKVTGSEGVVVSDEQSGESFKVEHASLEKIPEQLALEKRDLLKELLTIEDPAAK